MPQTRQKNVDKHLGLPDKPKTKRTSQQVKDDKEKESKKKEKAASVANKHLDKIKQLEALLVEQQASIRKTAANLPQKTQKKAHNNNVAIETHSREHPGAAFDIEDFTIGHSESSPPYIPENTLGEHDTNLGNGPDMRAELEDDQAGHEPRDIEDAMLVDEVSTEQPGKSKRKASRSSKEETASKKLKSNPMPAKPTGLLPSWDNRPTPPPSTPPTRKTAGVLKSNSLASSSSSFNLSDLAPGDDSGDDTDSLLKKFGGIFQAEDEDEDDSDCPVAEIRKLAKNIIVKVEPGVGTNNKTVRYGIRHLPAHTQEGFSTVFAPLLLLAVGLSKTPWEVPGEKTRKKIWEKVFPETSYQAKVLASPCRQKVYDWRSAMGKAGLSAATSFFASDRFKQREVRNMASKERENDPLDTTHEQKIRVYLKTAFEGPAYPFLWRNFAIVDGNIKCDGAFQSSVVLETFAVHFGVKGINKDPSTIASGLLLGKTPSGAMALACAAAHRAMLAYESGAFVALTEDFNEEHWMLYTERYVIEARGLKDKKWPAILDSVKPAVKKLNQSTRKGKKNARLSDPTQSSPHATMPDSDPIEPL